MTRMEALRSYTRDAAYAAFEEDLKGTLTPGKLADIVVLSQDITTIPEQAILQTQVIYTILGGKVLYERGARRSERGGENGEKQRADGEVDSPKSFGALRPKDLILALQ